MNIKVHIYFQTSVSPRIYTIQHKKKKSNMPAEKWAENLRRHFSKEDIDSQQAHGKMLNITNNQENEKGNHNDISSHT